MTETLTPPTTSDQPAPLPGRMTFEEFLAWGDGETRAEWVDGEIVLISPCSVPHQLLAGFLYQLLHSAVLPGFRLRVDWLWQSPLPTAEALSQIEA